MTGDMTGDMTDPGGTMADPNMTDDDERSRSSRSTAGSTGSRRRRTRPRHLRQPRADVFGHARERSWSGTRPRPRATSAGSSTGTARMALCREERVWVTADGVGNSHEPDRANEESQHHRRGGGRLHGRVCRRRAAGSPRGTAIRARRQRRNGPPRAVRVTMTFEFPPPKRGGQPVTKTLVQVIPVRTAPGAAIATLVDPGRPDRGCHERTRLRHGRHGRRWLGRRGGAGGGGRAVVDGRQGRSGRRWRR